MAKEFSYKVGVDPDKGIQGLKELQRQAEKSLGDVNNELQDGEDNAKAFAQAMRDAADRVEQRLKDVSRASDAMGKALGPELAARLGQNGLDKMVADMNQAGLTFDQITKDADELADGIKRLEQAGKSIGDRVGPEFDKIETSSRNASASMDKSGSVMANFAGNAAQDLPLVSQSMGAVNVAVGQFAEYATEGDIKLGSLIKTGLGMGAVTVGIMALNKVMDTFADYKERARERVEAFTKALKAEEEGLKGAVSAAAEKALADQGLIEKARQLGISTEDLTEAIAGRATPAWEALTKQYGYLASGPIVAVRRGQDDVARSAEELIRQVDIQAHAFGVAEKATFKAAKTSSDLKDRQLEAADVMDDQLKPAVMAVTGELIGQYDALVALDNKHREAQDAVFALAQEELRAKDQMLETTKAVKDKSLTLDEKKQSVIDYAEATLDLKDKQAAVNGEMLSAPEAAAAQTGALESLKKGVKDPELLGYIDGLIAKLDAVSKPRVLALDTTSFSKTADGRTVKDPSLGNGGYGTVVNVSVKLDSKQIAAEVAKTVRSNDRALG